MVQNKTAVVSLQVFKKVVGLNNRKHKQLRNFS